MAVTHNKSESRFELEIEDQVAVLEYELDGDLMTFTHTEVPEPFEGRGHGARLARAGLEYARQSGLRVIPACNFMAAFIRANPEYLELVSPGFRERLGRRAG